MKVAAPITLDRLSHLRPSDIENLKKLATQFDALTQIATTFAKYLVSLKMPGEAELDDLIGIALQLKAGDVWRNVDPAEFITALGHLLDPKTTLALSDALGVPSKPNPASKKMSSRIVAAVSQALAEDQASEHTIVRRLPLPEPIEDAAEQGRANTGLVRATRRQMSKSQLIERIATTTEVSKREVRNVMDTLVDVGHRELKKNGVFLVPGFAKFVVVKKPAAKARKGTNPFTGEEMTFKARPARKVVRATPVKAAKDSA